MDISRTPAERAGTPLGSLGLSSADEELYRLVLRMPGSTVAAVAALGASDPARTGARLARLAALGLVHLDGEVVSAVPPDEAIGRLISDGNRRMHDVAEQLDSLRGLLPSLVADHLAARAPRGRQVTLEPIETEDVVNLLRSMSATASGELLWLRPDQWRVPAGREIDDWVIEVVSAGRRSRAIYPAPVLEEAPHVVHLRAEAGEQVRIMAAVPSRLAIVGDAAALISEHPGADNGVRLVVRQHSLVTAFRVLFESLWERAIPVPGFDGHPPGRAQAGERKLLLDQLSRGAKDEQIARAMGLSLRTVRRRVADVLDELGVDSRFQAGVEAVRRGWI